MDKKVEIDASVVDQSQVDPVTFEVLRSIFEYASERMSTVLQRASFSPILADMVDFSNAIYDADAQLLSQAANCPIHLAAMKFSAEAIINKFGLENINEGDVITVNDPYQGGTHINDITFMMPIPATESEMAAMAPTARVSAPRTALKVDSTASCVMTVMSSSSCRSISNCLTSVLAMSRSE